LCRNTGWSGSFSADRWKIRRRGAREVHYNLPRGIEFLGGVRLGIRDVNPDDLRLFCLVELAVTVAPSEALYKRSPRRQFRE
jgi:hypothetical protein